MRAFSKSKSNLAIRLLVISVSLFSSAEALLAQSDLYTPASSYTTTTRFVGTHVFHTFTPFNTTTGVSFNAKGPWRPLEGREQWDGSVPFWKRQLKDIMDANIDVIFVHLWDPGNTEIYENSRINLFTAYSDLRREGYDTPRVACFLDPWLTWANFGGLIDLATTAGKNELVDQYVRFYDQYFDQNTDQYAEDYVAQINGKPVFNNWHFHEDWGTRNPGNLTRNDVESRVASAPSLNPYPIFNNGVYMIITATLNEPSWADEQMHQFSLNGYFETETLNGRRTATLKPGFWNENGVESVQIFDPRNGGINFRNAWNSLIQTKNQAPSIRHVVIESWNEYDEGSGLYEANTDPLYVYPPGGYYQGLNTDTWSSTGDPREYIHQVADRAPDFTGRADRSAEFIWWSIPTTVAAGATFDVDLVVRNQGNNEWRASSDYKLGIPTSSPFTTPTGQRRYLLNDSQDEIPKYGGIFRGRPRTFNIQAKAPMVPGVHNLKFQMMQEGETWFGAILSIPVSVSTTPAIVDFGTSDVNTSLRRHEPEPGNANTVGTTKGGRICRRLVNSGDRHFFMKIDDTWAYQGNKPAVSVTIDYFDSGTAGVDGIKLIYDSTSGNKSAGAVNFTNSRTWKTKSWSLTDAYFGNRSGVGYDFRLTSKKAGRILYLDKVTVSE